MMENKEELAKKAFESLGGVEGLKILSNSFYDIMEQTPKADNIRNLHPKDLEATRENLALFLSGWLGGPPLYKEKYGSANLTAIHSPFTISMNERDTWLECMEKALEQQPIEDEMKSYVLNRLRVPAEKIREVCEQQIKGLPVISQEMK